jgi:hypothetical protein
MNKTALTILAVLALASCACGPKQDIPKPDPGTTTPETPETPETPPENFEVQVPLKSEITHVQPMTGIVLWTTSSSVKKEYVQLEFSYMLYSDVCKEKDVYDWTPMDKLLEQVAARGHQAVVRFRYTYPGYDPGAVPAYIKEWPGYEATHAKSEGRMTEFPDWRCEELQRFHMEFHRLFAERYDKDPRLAFVETGFGLWAEYHIYDGPCVIGKTFPSHDFQAQFLPKMDEWFQDTPWLISIDAADTKYAPFHKQKDLLDLRFGNFDDSFMCEDWSGYNWSGWRFFGEERYKKAPGGGEFSYYSSYDQKHVLDKEGMYGRVFEDVVAKVHMTFIIGNDQPGKQTVERITEAAMSMGYRFEIRDYVIGENNTARIRIANVGVAPIYRDAFVELDGEKGELNLRTLMPGDEAWINFPHATLESVPHIVCDHLVEGQEIQYQADINQ